MSHILSISKSTAISMVSRRAEVSRPCTGDHRAPDPGNPQRPAVCSEFLSNLRIPTHVKLPLRRCAESLDLTSPADTYLQAMIDKVAHGV
jgi:hypothetical protein